MHTVVLSTNYNGINTNCRECTHPAYRYVYTVKSPLPGLKKKIKSALWGLFGTATYKVDCTLAPETSFLHH
jgi:hypothetical protein